MISYYNEFDPKAAAWLKQLIKNGNITNGEVDERSITEVKADDLMGFNRCHFFAGIGTWDYCLSEAGWGDRQVWTASLPCQPFSVAGKGLGKDDERHLLPHFLELVRQCKPDTIFGEQVAAAIKHGWLDDLHANMEAEGYSVGHCVFGAHSVGAAHIRQRLYWVANNASKRLEGSAGEIIQGYFARLASGGKNGGMGDTELHGHATATLTGSTLPTGEKRGQEGENISSKPTGAGESDSATNLPRCEGWEGVDWLYCRDNKYRPIKSGLKPLVDGSSKRMVFGSNSSEPIDADFSAEARAMRLKGYGNAIVAQCGIEFIQSFMDITFSHVSLNKK